MRDRLAPFIVCSLCIAGFFAVRAYGESTCNGQYPLGYDGPFGCAEDLPTTTGMMLDGLSISLPLLALFFGAMVLRKIFR
ncbi:MAG: hypothetical protein ACKOPE_02020 [Novosphingobium sp.]